jgi:diguanylate cyclase (GGDEF)-like protein
LAILWIDLDRFHELNHSLGHEAGDRLVLAVSERLQRAVPDCPWFRVAGDEFVVAGRGWQQADAEQVASEIHEALAPPIIIEQLPLHPSVSIGISILELETFEDVDGLGLLLQADRAMMTAKATGGNTTAVASTLVPGHHLIREELAIEDKIHKAMAHGGLTLHYQPILRRDGSLAALEALMRCSVDSESIPPAKLIPVAEKTGLVLRLGDWTMMQGAQFASVLLARGCPTTIAINVSRAQLLGPCFAETLHAVLITTGLPAPLLELELTESLFMDMSATVQDNLRWAHDVGVGLAIDDFGTGYSCLANLKDIPATKLKLDRSFISMVVSDSKSRAIVKAMSALGQDIGLTVVAEGVERAEQRDCLLDIGVDAMQGFLFAPPLSPPTLDTWLREHGTAPTPS